MGNCCSKGGAPQPDAATTDQGDFPTIPHLHPESSTKTLPHGASPPVAFIPYKPYRAPSRKPSGQLSRTKALEKGRIADTPRSKQRAVSEKQPEFTSSGWIDTKPTMYAVTKPDMDPLTATPFNSADAFSISLTDSPKLCSFTGRWDHELNALAAERAASAAGPTTPEHRNNGDAMGGTSRADYPVHPSLAHVLEMPLAQLGAPAPPPHKVVPTHTSSSDSPEEFPFVESVGMFSDSGVADYDGASTRPLTAAPPPEDDVRQNPLSAPPAS